MTTVVRDGSASRKAATTSAEPAQAAISITWSPCTWRSRNRASERTERPPQGVPVPPAEGVALPWPPPETTLLHAWEIDSPTAWWCAAGGGCSGGAETMPPVEIYRASSAKAGTRIGARVGGEVLDSPLGSAGDAGGADALPAAATGAAASVASDPTESPRDNCRMRGAPPPSGGGCTFGRRVEGFPLGSPAAGVVPELPWRACFAAIIENVDLKYATSLNAAARAIADGNSAREATFGCASFSLIAAFAATGVRFPI